MAIGFRGGSSGGSSGGIDFDSDYFDVPLIPLNKIIPRTDYSAPVTGGDGGTSSDNSFNAAAFNNSYDPVEYNPVSGGIDGIDYALYQGTNAHPMESGKEPSYFTTDSLTEQDIQNYLNDTENFVYNPGTGGFEPAGKYTYPLSKIAPGYSDTQERFMSGIKPGMTGDQLKAIEANRLNTQKLAFEVPLGQGVNMFDNYHTAYTGFDANTGQMVDPFDTNQTFDQMHQENVQNLKDSGQIHSGSVFEPGGAFGGKQ